MARRRKRPRGSFESEDGGEAAYNCSSLHKGRLPIVDNIDILLTNCSAPQIPKVVMVQLRYLQMSANYFIMDSSPSTSRIQVLHISLSLIPYKSG